MEEHEKTGELLVDLGSDQTSCHNPFNGGYYPVELGYEEAQEVLYLRREPDNIVQVTAACTVSACSLRNLLTLHYSVFD